MLECFDFKLNFDKKSEIEAAVLKIVCSNLTEWNEFHNKAFFHKFVNDFLQKFEK